jgi:hypothetical protein
MLVTLLYGQDDLRLTMLHEPGNSHNAGSGNRSVRTLTMAEIVSLAEAVAALVHDGDSVPLEGLTHLIPLAAGHELIGRSRTSWS